MAESAVQCNEDETIQMLPLSVTLCFLAIFVATVPTAVNLPVLQLPSGTVTPTLNFTNHTRYTSDKWPPLFTEFHVKGNLYFQIQKYGYVEDTLPEAEVLESLEMIGLDIETGGDRDPDGQVSKAAYRWDQVLLILGNLRIKPTWLTRRQASGIADLLSGLTMLYGPRELFAFAMQDRATGKLEFGALHFIPRDKSETRKDN
ncbi:MAG: hypothetical protein Q9225_001925 [Loekoesia sp. 1 TL-2023]